MSARYLITSMIDKMSEKPWYVFWVLGSCLIATIHWDSLYYRHDAPKWWVLDMFFAVYTTCKLLSLRHLGFTKIGVSCCCLVVWCLLTALWSSNVYAAIELGLRYGLLICAIYFLIGDLRNGGYENLAIVCTLTSCLAFFAVLVTERYILKLPFSNGNYTPLGFINHGGHVYVIWMPILSWGIFYLPKYWRILSALLLMACLWVLTDSAIRASIVGLAAGCLALAGLTLYQQRHVAYKSLVLLGVLAVAIAISSLLQGDDAYINAKIARVTQSANLNQVSSDRILMYKNTLNMIADNPLGVGLNNFEYIHPLYGKAGSPEASPFMNESEILRQPHNFYLKLTSETGWLGAGILALTILLVLKLFFFGQNNNPWRYAYYLALLAVFANALFCAVFSNPASLWFSALLLASHMASYQAEEAMGHAHPGVGIGIGVVIILTLVGLSSADITSQFLAAKGRVDQDSVKLQRAVAIYPGNERAIFDLATATYEQDGNPQLAIAHLQKFLELYPYHIGARFKLSQWYCQQQEYRRCKTELEHLLRYYPTFKSAQQLYYQASDASSKTSR